MVWINYLGVIFITVYVKFFRPFLFKVGWFVHNWGNQNFVGKETWSFGKSSTSQAGTRVRIPVGLDLGHPMHE